MSIISNQFFIDSVMAVICFLLGLLVGRFSKTAGGTAGGTAGARARPEDGRHGKGCVELYVGNLSYEVTDQELTKVFEKYGKVEGVRIIAKKSDGHPRGYGFVEMSDRSGAEAAIKALDGKELNGRTVSVNEARSRGRAGRRDR